MIPRLRYFAGEGRAMGDHEHGLWRGRSSAIWRRVCYRQTRPAAAGGLRVRDPILAHDTMSEEGVSWLREASGSGAPRDAATYIRRNAQGARAISGGGYPETAGLQTLLRDFASKRSTSGNGEHGVAAQIAMLEAPIDPGGARRRADTNLAYLHGDLKVIEIVGSRTRHACFMHLAAMLGFAYRGIFSSVYDDRLDIIVDLDELRAALGALA